MVINKSVTILAVLQLFSYTASAQSVKQTKRSQKVNTFLRKIIAEKKIPGIIAAIASSKGVMAIGSAGVRKVGSEAELTINDKVHLGSCTKAMTATLMAILVADGKVKWESTLTEVLPGLKGDIHPDYYNITLWQLLTHQSGMPANATSWWRHGEKSLMERRRTLLKENLNRASTTGPGKYLYSNLGYMAAGCMAEKLTGLTWEALVKKHLFIPLGMTSAGFGPPCLPGKLDQPWGHAREDDSWRPLCFDNPEALGPAGRVHCTTEDWVRFIAIQLPQGSTPGLDDKLVAKLVTPAGEYGGGWHILRRAWGKGVVLTHSGSNTMWFTTVWVAPKLDRAFIVATNSCDEGSASICDQVISKLISFDRENSKTGQ